MSKLVPAVALVMILMFVAFTFPVIIGESDGTTSSTLTLSEGESDVVTENLRVTVVESTGSDVEVTATNLRTGTSDTQTIVEGETGSYNLDSETVNITADRTGNDFSTLTVEYPRTFGWDESSSWFVDNLDIFMVVIAFVSIMGVVAMVVRQ